MMRPALMAKAGSRGNIQHRCCHGRSASWLSHRQSVVPLMWATRPWSMASRRNSLSDQCAKGKPRREGNSQANALISTMTLGGKARRSPAARVFFEPGQALKMKTATPFADDLTRRVEPCRDRVIGHSFTRQQHDLGANHIPVAGRVAPRSCQQFRTFRFAQYDVKRTPPRHDPTPKLRSALTDSCPSRTKYVTVFMKSGTKRRKTALHARFDRIFT